MKLTDTLFSFPRFVSFCRKDLVEDWKKNLMRIALVYGLMAVAFVWNAIAVYNAGFTSSVYRTEMVLGVWTFVLGGLLSASFVCERLKTKTGRTAILSLPATSFEKFFSRWFFFTLGFIGIFFIAFFLADYTRLLVGKVFYPELEGVHAMPFARHFLYAPSSDSWALFNDGNHLLIALFAYFLFQSFFVLGSTLWPKNAFLKTFVALLVTGIVLTLFTVWVASMIIPNGFRIDGDISQPTAGQVAAVFCIVTGLGTLFNWTLAYFRFKEMEVINRW